MLSRRLFCMVTVVALIAGSTLALAAEIHSGKVLSIGKSSLTIRDDRDGEDELIQVTAETKITRNGKPAKLSDIGIGDKAKVDAKEAEGKLTAKSIEAFVLE
jgi:hypothetical protein